MNKRFGRLESHVVTLARSVAHLSSELRSQASISQDVDDMRRQVQDQQFRADDSSDLARESALLQSRVKKLRRYISLTGNDETSCCCSRKKNSHTPPMELLVYLKPPPTPLWKFHLSFPRTYSWYRWNRSVCVGCWSEDRKNQHFWIYMTCWTFQNLRKIWLPLKLL